MLHVFQELENGRFVYGLSLICAKKGNRGMDAFMGSIWCFVAWLNVVGCGLYTAHWVSGCYEHELAPKKT